MWNKIFYAPPARVLQRALVGVALFALLASIFNANILGSASIGLVIGLFSSTRLWLVWENLPRKL
ncbi:MAG: hypothetical protein WAX89_06075 [Alphaproteobacteria bacterium]